jgi:hypothetical protein
MSPSILASEADTLICRRRSCHGLVKRQAHDSFIWRAVYSPELIARAGSDPFHAANRRGQYRPEYRAKDVQRWAALYGVPYSEPDRNRVNWRRLALACVVADRRGAGDVYANNLLTHCFSGKHSPPATDDDLIDLARLSGLASHHFIADLVVWSRPLMGHQLAFSGRGVARELTMLAGRRGKAGMIVSDNGTEFASMLAWAQDNQIVWHFIPPGNQCRTASVRASTAACATSLSMRACSLTLTMRDQGLRTESTITNSGGRIPRWATSRR